MKHALVFGLLTICVALWNSNVSAQHNFRAEVKETGAEAWTKAITTHIANYVRQAGPELRRAYKTAKPAGHVVIVRILAVPDGRVVSVHVEKSSGRRALDEIALRAVRRASPLPPFDPPPRLFKLPIKFHSLM